MKKTLIILLSLVISGIGFANTKNVPSSVKKAKTKKIYILVGYNFGMSSNTVNKSYTSDIYSEQAGQQITYDLKMGNSFGFGIGYNITKKIAVELHAEMTKHEIANKGAFSVPHPFFFDLPRHFDGSTGSYSASSTKLALNFSYKILNSRKIDIEIFAGPSTSSTKAELLSGVSFSDQYPYDTVTLNFQKKEVKKSIFGINGGIRFYYKFSSSISVFLNGSYVQRSDSFDLENDYLSSTLDFGGASAGIGLRVSL